MNCIDALSGLARVLKPACVIATLLVCCTNEWAQASPDNDSGQQTHELGQVLIITGEDYPGHKWKQTTPVLKEQLAQDRRLVVTVTDDLRFLTGAGLKGFDTVVVHFKNYDPAVPGREGFLNLQQFVREGGGLVLVHFACGAFQEFKQDFTAVAGRAWNPELRGHDPHGTFQVDIAKTAHPITHGLAPFETTDELYTCLEGEPSITVLANAESKVDGKRYPMAFVLEYGQGRVFHCLLGHDAEALSVSAVGELYRRGCAWTAGIEPVAQGTTGAAAR